MKSMLKKAVAFFLLGLVVMQALFTGDSKEASADHSDSASLKYIQGMRINAKTTKAFTNLPAPYNTSTHAALSAIAIKDASKKTYDLSYCIGYDKAASNKDKLSSKNADTSCIMTAEQARWIF